MTVAPAFAYTADEMMAVEASRRLRDTFITVTVCMKFKPGVETIPFSWA